MSGIEQITSLDNVRDIGYLDDFLEQKFDDWFTRQSKEEQELYLRDMESLEDDFKMEVAIYWGITSVELKNLQLPSCLSDLSYLNETTGHMAKSVNPLRIDQVLKPNLSNIAIDYSQVFKNPGLLGQIRGRGYDTIKPISLTWYPSYGTYCYTGTSVRARIREGCNILLHGCDETIQHQPEAPQQTKAPTKPAKHSLNTIDSDLSPRQTQTLRLIDEWEAACRYQWINADHVKAISMIENNMGNSSRSHGGCFGPMQLNTITMKDFRRLTSYQSNRWIRENLGLNSTDLYNCTNSSSRARSNNIKIGMGFLSLIEKYYTKDYEQKEEFQTGAIYETISKNSEAIYESIADFLSSKHITVHENSLKRIIDNLAQAPEGSSIRKQFVTLCRYNGNTHRRSDLGGIRHYHRYGLMALYAAEYVF